METTRFNPFGGIQRQAPGFQGGGRLFYLRRERDLARGLLSPKGRGNDYLVFQPSKYFARIIGDRIFRLNEALSEVRAQGAKLIPSMGVARLQAHYADLDQLIEAARDRLESLIDYCHKGSTGRFREALEGNKPDLSQARTAVGLSDLLDESGAPKHSGARHSEPSEDGGVEEATATAAGTDVFDALRQRHFEQGILTEYGRDQGCVAFQPCPFYGRFLGEVVYSLNDALRRLEGNTSYYVMIGDSESLQSYYRRLEGSLMEVGRNLDGIIGWCEQNLA